MARVHDSAANTAIFSLTHHPALSVPCGTVDGLPVGMMLVGKHFDETTVLRAGQAVETHCS
jgi:amidase